MTKLGRAGACRDVIRSLGGSSWKEMNPVILGHPMFPHVTSPSSTCSQHDAVCQDVVQQARGPHPEPAAMLFILLTSKTI